MNDRTMQTMSTAVHVGTVTEWSGSRHKGRDDWSVFIGCFQFVGTPDELESLAIALTLAVKEIREGTEEVKAA